MEKKLYHWLKANGPLGAALLVTGLCALIAAWNIYWAPLQQGEVYQYTKYNDEYDTILDTGVGSWEITQSLTLEPDQKVYGLRLLFDTANVSAQGTFEAVVQTPQGQPLATTGVLNAAALLDGDFQGFAFGSPQGLLGDNLHVDGREHPQVVVRLIYRMAEGWEQPQPLSLWVSSKTISDQLTFNGQPAEGTLALQLMTENASGWTARMGAVLFFPLLGAVIAALVLWVRGAAPCWLVPVVGGLLGLSFAFVTPPQVGPDEYAHIAGCYEKITQLTQGSTVEDHVEAGVVVSQSILIREADGPAMEGQTGPIGPVGYKHALQGLTQRGVDGELTLRKTLRLTQTNTWYLFLPQLAGVLLGRSLGLGFYAMALAGRLLNLGLYLLLAFWAVRLAPKEFQGLFTGVLLLPMSLQLGASFSPDSTVVGLAALFTALCLRFGRAGQVTLPQWGGLLALAFLLAPAKVIYLPLTALVFLIPGSAFGKKPAGRLKQLAVLGAGLAGTLCFSGDYLAYVTRDVDYALFYRILLAGGLPAVLLVGFYCLWVRKRPKAKLWFWRLVGYGGLCAFCLVIFLLSRGSYHISQEELSAVQENGDALYNYTIGYILRNLPATLKLVWNTLLVSSQDWLTGLLGTSLGEPIVYPIQVNGLLTLGLALVLALQALGIHGQPPRLKAAHRWGCLGIGLAVSALCLAACLTWTPINYKVMFGVQGRYFLPVISLFLLWLGDTKLVKLEKPCPGGLAFAQAAMTMMVLSQGFLLYCQGA